ncbi:MAG: hypothetical protein R2705_24030 [Ilumatobacteraceae bacterium]
MLPAGIEVIVEFVSFRAGRAPEEFLGTAAPGRGGDAPPAGVSPERDGARQHRPRLPVRWGATGTATTRRP